MCSSDLRAARIAGANGFRRDVARDDRARADDGFVTDVDSGHDKRARADEGAASDENRRGDQGLRGLRKIVGTRAQIRLLRDGRILADANRSERIGIRAVAEARAVAKLDVPRHRDARALVHERHALDPRAEQSQPQQAPCVERLDRKSTRLNSSH